MSKSVDWEAVEREYRSGQLSLREIGRVHGVSDTAIRKKAKSAGWERDLSIEVQKAVRSKLVRGEVRTPNAQDDEVVEVAASRAVEVVLSHRRDISGLRTLAETLKAKAVHIIETVADLKGLDGAVGIVESLARTAARLQPLERQAFGMDNKVEKEDGEDVEALLRARARCAKLKAERGE